MTTKEVIWEIIALALPLIVVSIMLRKLGSKPHWALIVIAALIGKALATCWA